MARPIPRFEVGDTREFTATYSFAPLGPPLFTMHAGSGDGTLVFSVTATSSSSLAWFTAFTFPQSRMLYTYTWQASFNDGFTIDVGYAQAIKTIPG